MIASSAGNTVTKPMSLLTRALAPAPTPPPSSRRNRGRALTHWPTVSVSLISRRSMETVGGAWTPARLGLTDHCLAPRSVLACLSFAAASLLRKKTTRFPLLDQTGRSRCPFSRTSSARRHNTPMAVGHRRLSSTATFLRLRRPRAPGVTGLLRPRRPR